jgi:hypothetical protein
MEASMKVRVFRDVAPCSHVIALMMEEVRASETSVNFNVITRRYIPEVSKLHTQQIASKQIFSAGTFRVIESSRLPWVEQAAHLGKPTMRL